MAKSDEHARTRFDEKIRYHPQEAVVVVVVDIRLYLICVGYAEARGELASSNAGGACF